MIIENAVYAVTSPPVGHTDVVILTLELRGGGGLVFLLGRGKKDDEDDRKPVYCRV